MIHTFFRPATLVAAALAVTALVVAGVSMGMFLVVAIGAALRSHYG